MDSDYGATRELSSLQKQRALYRPALPPCLQGTAVRVEYGAAAIAADSGDANVISHAFPHTYGQPLAHFLPKTDAAMLTEHPVVRVGVVFSGRQSPGGHNVIWGLYDAINAHNPSSKLIGFLGGTDGLFAQKTLEITDEVISSYKNQGGYDMLGRTRDQIRTTEQVKAAITTCQALKLDALVIIGGVTSNTDAAQLAETFAESKCSTKVVGVPVTLNGDLKNQFVETTVGFDTICKVNSQLISNVCTDALSAEKVLLGVDVAASKLTISDITKQICDAVQARAEKDKYHGVVLIPEGLVESIPELYALLQEIHGLHDKGVSIENISSHLSPWASALFDFLPPFIRKQLLLHPESDDSAQLSQIETEKLLAQLVETEINKRLILGHVSYHILAAGLSGYMATVTNLKSHVDKWKCGAAPITAFKPRKTLDFATSRRPIPQTKSKARTMLSASLAARLLRRAASSPRLSTLTRRCAHSSATSRPPVPLHRLHAAAASSPSGITARRFLASQSPVSSSKISADENLRRVIDSEIECVVESEEGSAQKIDLPEDFPFEIVDNPGDQSIVLKREFAGQTIKATVYTNFDAEEDLNNDDSDAENDEDQYKPAVQMVVTIEKPEGSILEFECNFNDDELAIENMRMLNRDSNDKENLYEGPPFSILDESLQKSLHRYLEVRGIKHSLHDWLTDYMMGKDEKEYVVWLKNMREFIGK
ncbi:hypothetical protein ACQ4PT_047797 [Festuca glaucescens]